MSGLISRDLHLAHLSSYTHKMATQLEKPLRSLKSVLRNKYRSLLHFVYSNQKKIYEIFINDMFLQCYDLSYGVMTV